jgi:cytochrome c-type biogenesis protein CcmH/NrfG
LAADDPERAAKLLRASAESSGSGEIWLLLGRLESEREAWGSAQAALQKALKLGGLSTEGEAQIMLGVALYNQRQVDAALSAWGEAKKHSASAKEAAQWIDKAQGERKSTKPSGKSKGAK